jgi:dephospho-CoA kinase
MTEAPPLPDDSYLRIGLTGGIASGKSTVARLFAAKGVPVIDLDEVAREVVEPGRPALAAIAEEFGEDLLDAEGRLDRGALRRRVFEDPEARRRLEALLHPRILEEAVRLAGAAGGPYQLFVVPLLVESGLAGWVDRVLVVDCPVEAQLERLLARDGGDEAEARAMLAAQASRKQRLAVADDVILNDGGLDRLPAAVEVLDGTYRAIAAGAEPPAGGLRLP